ncbi:MAG: thioredoxin [Candidatus Omnitrophica bacterium]|nr:thioredoxin [Candidatus Omnitrophota bacterium]
MAALHLNEKNFEQEVLKSSLPVLVDFWAQWCGPCRALAPVIEELSTELNGKMVVGKVDVDEAQNLAADYEVSSIPTLMIFKNGQAVDQLIGVMPKAQLLAKIKPHLS